MTNRDKLARWQEDYASEGDDIMSLLERASGLLSLLAPEGQPIGWIEWDEIGLIGPRTLHSEPGPWRVRVFVEAPITGEFGQKIVHGDPNREEETGETTLCGFTALPPEGGAKCGCHRHHLCDTHREQFPSPQESGEPWLPTAENVNALPQGVRKYIHDIETRCDQAHEVRELAIAKDTIRALEAERNASPQAAEPDFWIYQSDSGCDDQVLDGAANPAEGFRAVYLAPPDSRYREALRLAEEALEKIRDDESILTARVVARETLAAIKSLGGE